MERKKKTESTAQLRVQKNREEIRPAANKNNLKNSAAEGIGRQKKY